MDRKFIVVGVDATPESARAATLAWAIATAGRLDCRLVHVVRDFSADALALTLPPNLASIQQALEDDARDAIEKALREALPQPVLTHLRVDHGSPGAVLARHAEGAEMLVMGGKHHSAIGRWLVGSTVHQIVRTSATPTLIAGPTTAPSPRRVLAALDFSPAADATLDLATRVAGMLGGDLGVLHVVEPLPPTFDQLLGPASVPEGVLDDEARFEAAARVMDESVWPRVRYPRAEKLLRRGLILETLAREVRDWGADVLVVGTHGRGWMERLLLGSVTHRLLNDLPVSLLVAPVPWVAPAAEPLTAAGAAHA